VSDTEIQRVEDKLNSRPRKILGYRTPREVFFCTSLLNGPDEKTVKQANYGTIAEPVGGQAATPRARQDATLFEVARDPDKAIAPARKHLKH
jgi:hypothetical protein